MDWDKRGIRNEIAVGGKESTRKVEALFYICADRGLLKAAAHGLCDAHKSIRKESQDNGVGFV
jgi:hypothetical protein